MKRLFAIILLGFTGISALFAQGRGGMPSPEMLERIKAEKISFFTSKLELTTKEAQDFWPIYNEYEKKKMDVHREIWDFEHQDQQKLARMSNAELEKLTVEYTDLLEKEVLITKDYNKLFLRILPARKVLMIYQVENQFRAHLIREFRKDRND
jgi:hypothetical protein